MDTSQAVTHIGLCAGYGGIELGLKRAVPGLRTVALCEIEAFAIANLVAKMEAGLMDPAPIWPDLKTFPWAAFRDRVDILTGGYPCQPFSAAGQRKGKQDPRHLWPFIADGIRLLRPKCCFFENVEGHISLGLSDVIEDLAGMGYRTTWGIFSASECGAPHQRKRVFILAVASGLGGASGLSGPFPRHEGQSGEPDDGCGEDMADTGSTGPQGQRGERGHGESGSQVQVSRSGGNPWPSRPRELADAERDGRRASTGDAGTMGTAQCSQEVSKSQPRTTTSSAHSGCDSHAWPSRPGEQQYGWEPPRVVADSHRIDRSAQAEGREHDRQAGPAGEELGDAEDERCGRMDDEPSEVSSGETRGHADWANNPEQQEQWQTQPTLGGDADGSAGGLDYAELCVTCDNRTDELRLLGNGVVPATAERAFRVLIKELL